MRLSHIASVLTLSLGFVGSSAQAAILALDFGDAGAYSGTNTPAHADGAESGTLTYSQFTVSNSNGSAGYALPSAGTATVYSMRSGSANNDTADRVRQTYNVGAVSGAGIFNTDLTLDGQASFSSTSNYRPPIGYQIEGLANGTYTAYLVAHHAGNTGTAMRVHAGVQGSVTSTISAGASNFVAAVDASNTATWQANNNYVKVAFTIDATNPVVYFLVHDPVRLAGGSTASVINTSISSITIVPEPTTLAGLAMASLMLVRRRR